MATHKSSERSSARAGTAAANTAATKDAAPPAADSGVPAGPRPGTRAHSALQRYREGRPPYNREPDGAVGEAAELAPGETAVTSTDTSALPPARGA